MLAVLGPMAVFTFAHASAACELPRPRDPAKPGVLYHVVMGASQVRFDAKAFLHTFAGTTSRVEGSIRVGDLDRLSDAAACIRIDAASLDTGNRIRDGNMREGHLETSRFPTIDFLLTMVDGMMRQPGRWQFMASGTLSLHGVEREVRFPIRAREEGETVVLTGQLPLKMTDYGIPIPRFLLLSVEDQVLVSFDVTAKRAS